MAWNGLDRCGAACAAAAVALALVLAGTGERTPGPAPAYETVALPVGVDSITPLAAVSQAPAAGVIYAWTPRMPLSRLGIPEVVAAARSLDLPITLVSTEELLDYAHGNEADAPHLPIADAMLTAGMLTHAPALVVVSRGAVVGPAILGYKRTDAYRALIDARAHGAAAPPPTDALAFPTRPAAVQAPRDLEAVGLPGAYFRWVPGTRWVAYESDRSIYLLDVDSGENLIAPGWIDFVPTPDGRYFVTPGPQDEGLTFFDARDVFDAARRNRSMSVESIFTDMRMRDQYPSVGILEHSDAVTRYRVLTSWFDGLVYRDYEIRVNAASGASSVRPIGEPVVPCAGFPLSTPIMSQDGREVAARDERTGTTKVFRILDEGRCEEVLDFGVPTSKVAWRADGQAIAFATPRRSRESPQPAVFVFDRGSARITPVPGSEAASRLAFPDFVGDDAVVFLLPGETMGDPSVFRLVEGIR